MKPQTIREASIHKGGTIIKTSPYRGGQPYGQSPYGIVTVEAHLGQLKPSSCVNKDLVEAIDQYVSESVYGEKVL
jgi:hypothetical protein